MKKWFKITIIGDENLYYLYRSANMIYIKKNYHDYSLIIIYDFIFNVNKQR